MKADKKYNVKLELIAPKDAKRLLDTSPRNRKVHAGRVKLYSENIKAGKWGPCSMIIIDEDGQLVDGHHRLQAICTAGMSAWMVVFSGLEKEFIPFIDTGRIRTAGDMLAFIDGLDGVGSLRNKSTICRLVLALRAGDFSKMIGYDDIASFMLDNISTINAAYDYYGTIKPIGGTLATGAAACLILDKYGNTPQVAAFFEKVANGENLVAGMPEYALRNALFANGRRGGGGDRQRRDLFYMLTAWHDRCSGCERKLYRMPKEIESKTLLELV